MNRLLAILTLVLVFLPAHASSVAGLRTYEARSAEYDIIRCVMYGTSCYVNATSMSPMEFANRSGYDVIHRRSVAIVGDRSYIIMEVERTGTPIPSWDAPSRPDPNAQWKSIVITLMFGIFVAYITYRYNKD